jgi:hypothetical protein
LSRKTEKKSFPDVVEEIFSKIDVEPLRKLISEILLLRKENEFKLDISVGFARASYPSDMITNLSKKTDLDKDTINQVIGVFPTLLRYVIIKGQKSVLERFKEKPQLIEKVDQLFKFLDVKMEEYPEIISRFYVLSYCKTNFLQDFDWEINRKLIQPKQTGFENWEQFPVCVLHLVYKSAEIYGESAGENKHFSIELSLDDVNLLVNEFSKIRDHLLELRQKRRIGE